MSESAAGVVMDPWRFDPIAAARAANRVIAAGANASTMLHAWIRSAASNDDAVAAVIAVQIAAASGLPIGQPDTFRAGAPHLPHHPFMLSQDVPFLAAESIESAGAMPAPADLIDLYLTSGTLRTSALAPGEPVAAERSLESSDAWNATIDPAQRDRARRMVRWQAIRALGRPEMLVGIQPATASDDEFERWWLQRAGRA